VEADVRGRQPRRRDRVDRLHRGDDATGRLTEVEHHAVAQPPHDLAVVALGGPLDRRGESLGEVRGCLVEQPAEAQGVVLGK
jgi:hypothetical protein